MISTGPREAFRGDAVTIKLLAVDDSNTMRKVLGITFAGDSFAATICKTGSEALEHARAAAPDVALVDAYLAGENGYELCAKLRAMFPSLPILILASKQRPYDEGAGRTAGAMGSFDKPFDSQKLLDKIQSLSSSAGEAPRAPAPVPAPAPVVAPAPVPAVERSPAPSVAVPRPSSTFSGAPAPRPQAPMPAAQKPSTGGVAIGAVALTQRAVPVGSVAAMPAAQQAPLSTAAVNSASVSMATKLNGLGLNADQVQAVLALSREVVEQVVWEVVPALAETMIKEEIRRLTADAR
jgi:CheY-like chemotaxis protein